MAFLSIISEVTAPTGLWAWLILNVFSFIADYGWRIVFFTFCLKLLLSPIDIYQRYKARKNQLITLKLKPQMDKLQKMYGNDQKMLAQKQMELSKKAGISYFSSCLPAIITLVVFLTLFSRGLQPISQYQNFRQYEQLYNTYVRYCDDNLTEKRYNEIFASEIDKAKTDAETKKSDIRNVESDKLKEQLGLEAYNAVVQAEYERIYAAEYAEKYKAVVAKKDSYLAAAKKALVAQAAEKAYNDVLKEKLSAYTYDEYCALSDKEKTAIADAAQYGYNVAVNSFDESANQSLIEEKAEKEMKLAAENAVRQIAENTVQKAATEAKNAVLSAYTAEDHAAELDVNTEKAIAQTAENTVRTKANNYCKDIAQTKVFEAYESGVKMNFLWIKNIWNADTFWTNPINKYDGFIKNIGAYAKPGKGIPEDQLGKMLNSAKYNDVMGKLLDDPEYNSANGYMILPVLTVLLSVVMQVISYRQQKQGGQMNAQNESMSKIMMFVMPVFMAWFAFSYTAAFALYLVMSYIVSIAISLIGSLVVKIADKKTEKSLVTEVQHYGRPDFSDRKNDKNDK